MSYHIQVGNVDSTRNAGKVVRIYNKSSKQHQTSDGQKYRNDYNNEECISRACDN